MAWRSGGSLSRSLMSAARVQLPRSSAPRHRLRPPPSSAPRLQSRRLSFAPSRNLGELGCMQSFLPLVTTGHLTSRLNANLRAFCELSHGTFCRSCPDR
ncbi:hypothetical protein DKX38_014251 [Salix brachista]|uniref:Uncharacterized protein n=1 Tax=Salix brachista TaxID=2182728 RepID=A0A5N5LEV4_9ROSI|nr:hypothetical protein DKX38_014251 [Salix brachista]